VSLPRLPWSWSRLRCTVHPSRPLGGFLLSILTALAFSGPAGGAPPFHRDQALSGSPASLDPTWLRDPRALSLGGETPPARVHEVLQGLTSAQRWGLAAAHPAVVGNLEGAPLGLRYAANRASIAQSPEFRGWDAPRRQFLVFDPRGDGRVAEVFGDLAGADRVAVIVPGVDQTIRNFDSPSARRRGYSPDEQGRGLYAQMHAVDEKAAVVAWLGYDPPEGTGPSAMREERAAAGAVALRNFVDGLTVVNPRARFTLIGHSYGSVVVGRAAPSLSPHVTDLIVLGSPGMGVENKAELKSHARLWAAPLAPSDWVRWLPSIRLLGLGHGEKPTTPGFGAASFSIAGAQGHDGYLQPGTVSLTNIAEIALGHLQDVR
jgi:hypothetical protein